MVGRPKTFDEAEALERAMEVFWARGYEATSVQDLLDAMGINRGSMYDTFGDKHALFSAAIEHYGGATTERLETTLQDARSPLDGIRRVLRTMGDNEGGSCRGCLTTNAIVELAPHDPEIAAIVRGVLQGMERAFASALRRAVDAGELPRDADVRALARFLASVGQGLIVLSKASASRAQVKDTIDVAMAALG